MQDNILVINDLLPILTSGNTGVWVCNASSGLMDFKNDFFSILGLTGQDVGFSTLNELRALIHTDDIQDFEQAFAAASAGENTTVAYRFKQTLLESTMMSCSNGVIACTLNKDTMMHLQRLEKQSKKVVNAMFPNFIWVWDDDFHIVDVITPDGLKLFHSREQLIGTDARNYYAPEVNELIITNIRESLKNKQWKEVEYYIDLFGTRYFYQSRIVPLNENIVFCLCMEIGDRVRRMDNLLTQRQRAQESDRMKNLFIANMSHEIRTPLNAIIGFSEFLTKELTPQKRHLYTDIVQKCSIVLFQIVNDILDLSRMEAGISEFHFEDTDIIALMMEEAEMYMADMKPGVRFLTDFPDGNIQAPTDAGYVKQVLFNLISNAVKCTEKGAIILKLEASDEYLIFSVADTGCGIPEDKLEVIFDRFEKLNRFVQGTGLGLVICKSIVERLGGSLTVTSKTGEGSVFSFSIPYRNVAPDKGNIGIERINTAKRRKIILLAETAEDNLQFVRENLSKKYDVVAVTDPEKIINSFILDHPNIVLMCMEIVGKQEIIRKIRDISPNIPIIAMTSSDYYHDQRQAFENGCTDVIAKPFSASKLEEIVMAFIV